MRRILLVAIVTLAVLASPCFPQQEENEGSAYLAGRLAGELDTNRWLWGGAGCLFGILGIAAAYLIEPSPPMYRLIGKSDEYQLAYIEAYKAAGKRKQVSVAAVGCLLGTAFNLLVLLQ